MRGRRRARVGLALLVVVVACGAGLGCRTLRHVLDPPPRLAPCRGPIAPVAALPGGDFLLRERVRVRGDGVDAGFELVAERRGDRLVLVGLNAFGAEAFQLIQQGLDVESASDLGPLLPVPPENLLRDLHAARLARPHGPQRVEVARPGCGYTATFVRVERRRLP